MITIREEFATYAIGGMGHNNLIYKNPSVYEIKDIFKEYYGSWTKVPDDDRFLRVIIRLKGDLYAWVGQGDFHKNIADDLKIKDVDGCWFCEMYLTMEGKVKSISARYAMSGGMTRPLQLGLVEEVLSKNKNIKNIAAPRIVYI